MEAGQLLAEVVDSSSLEDSIIDYGWTYTLGTLILFVVVIYLRESCNPTRS